MRKIGTWSKQGNETVVRIPKWTTKIRGKEVEWSAIFGATLTLFDIEKYMLEEEKTHVKLIIKSPNSNMGDVMELE